ncbi:hypothetical protein SAMN05421543_1126 [Alicyclobacillus macrosporangiidus]|uniref:Uncharacterized protein n=1 Tax=Alicyclobacillus macrosporangiidus TaxID=392015 RepID=A0A1I7JUV9_9BACL|nr:hypothetical protein SAMN05421543_1126 [Alicyclobacillus macrosporangiidus]
MAIENKKTLTWMGAIVLCLVVYIVAVSVKANSYHSKVKNILIGATSVAASEMKSYMSQMGRQDDEYDPNAVNLGVGVI